MAEGGLSTLDQSLTNVGDTEGGLVGADDVVVDNGSQVQSDIVFGHADLLRHFDVLDTHIDPIAELERREKYIGRVELHSLYNALGQRVDLDQTGVDSLVEATKLGDQADIALVDVLIRVGAADAARDSAHRPN